jgi:hypothetical protein
LSPLVQRKRPIRPAQSTVTGPVLYRRVLFYASLLGGISALFLAVAFLMAVLGIYVILVWPLTFWDLANVGLEELGSWTWVLVAATFSGGALSGYCYFSGFSFAPKPKSKMLARSVRAMR